MAGVSIKSEVRGEFWQFTALEGDPVQIGDSVAILKVHDHIEIVEATVSGVLLELAPLERDDVAGLSVCNRHFRVMVGFEGTEKAPTYFRWIQERFAVFLVEASKSHSGSFGDSVRVLGVSPIVILTFGL